MGLQRDGTKGCGVQGEPSFCGKLYIISVFYRQDSHLLLTFIETKILFLKSHNFIIWSRIHSTLSFDNYTYNELLPSSKVKAFSLGLQAVTELWLHTTCLPEAIHHQKYVFSQKQWVSANMAAMWKWDKKAYYQSPKQLMGTVQNKPPQGAASTFLLTVSMSVTCTPTNKQTQKWFRVTPHTSSLLQGVNLFRKQGRGGN